MQASPRGLAADGGTLVGARIRVRALGSVPDRLRGARGTITQRFGHPEFAAYDVRLETDGRQHLFWHHQLEGAE